MGGALENDEGKDDVAVSPLADTGKPRQPASTGGSGKTNGGNSNSAYRNHPNWQQAVEMAETFNRVNGNKDTTPEELMKEFFLK